jgi:hypothetical protein
MEAIISSETSIYIWTVQLCIPQDGGSHNYRCENLKSYTVYTNFYPEIVTLLSESKFTVCVFLYSVHLGGGEVTNMLL